MKDFRHLAKKLRQLTLDEVKSLHVGDRIFVQRYGNKECEAAQVRTFTQQSSIVDEGIWLEGKIFSATFVYTGYGKLWTAYVR